MRLHITPLLRIDLVTERWECRACGQPLCSARENYKCGLLMHVGEAEPEPAPGVAARGGPALCLLYEYFCPGCGTRIEAELQAPGHLPCHDIELDLDALQREGAAARPAAPGPQETGP